MNFETPPSPIEHQPNQESEPRISAERAHKIGGKAVLVARVMNLESHSGVEHREPATEDGEGERITYTVDSRQYPDQGDFAFAGETAYEDALTRAYPNYTGNVHLVQARAEDVVTPYPDDAPNLVYLKNGATVQAVRVPKQTTAEHVDRVNSGQSIADATAALQQRFFPPEGEA